MHVPYFFISFPSLWYSLYCSLCLRDNPLRDRRTFPVCYADTHTFTHQTVLECNTLSHISKKTGMSPRRAGGANELKLKGAKQSVSSQQGWTTVCAAGNSKKKACSLAGLSQLCFYSTLTTGANFMDHLQPELPHKQNCKQLLGHIWSALFSHTSCPIHF